MQMHMVFSYTYMICVHLDADGQRREVAALDVGLYIYVSTCHSGIIHVYVFASVDVCFEKRRRDAATYGLLSGCIST
jgi:hypothetical protein